MKEFELDYYGMILKFIDLHSSDIGKNISTELCFDGVYYITIRFYYQEKLKIKWKNYGYEIRNCFIKDGKIYYKGEYDLNNIDNIIKLCKKKTN